MNNRYLFKGKTIDNEEWIIGYYEESNGRSYINYEETIEKHGKSIKVIRSKEVIPETVRPCMGLKDNDGKLMFEGDIIECYSDYEDVLGYSRTIEYCGVIVWNATKYCWSIKTNNELMPFNDYDWDIAMVIGNIYDNAELLEVEE